MQSEDRPFSTPLPESRRKWISIIPAVGLLCTAIVDVVVTLLWSGLAMLVTNVLLQTACVVLSVAVHLKFIKAQQEDTLRSEACAATAAAQEDSEEVAIMCVEWEVLHWRTLLASANERVTKSLVGLDCGSPSGKVLASFATCDVVPCDFLWCKVFLQDKSSRCCFAVAAVSSEATAETLRSMTRAARRHCLDFVLCSRSQLPALLPRGLDEKTLFVVYNLGQPLDATPTAFTVCPLSWLPLRLLPIRISTLYLWRLVVAVGCSLHSRGYCHTQLATDCVFVDTATGRILLGGIENITLSSTVQDDILVIKEIAKALLTDMGIAAGGVQWSEQSCSFMGECACATSLLPLLSHSLFEMVLQQTEKKDESGARRVDMSLSSDLPNPLCPVKEDDNSLNSSISTGDGTDIAPTSVLIARWWLQFSRSVMSPSAVDK